MKDIKNLSFDERAKFFKEAVMKAEKRYGVEIRSGYISPWDEEDLIICDVKNEQEVYFDTLRNTQ
jgi:hypothetical protein